MQKEFIIIIKLNIMRLTIQNCAECPFANHDNEYGTDACNINDKIVMKKFQELPNDKVHEECHFMYKKII